MMAKCPRCGAPLAEGSADCPACGGRDAVAVRDDTGPRVDLRERVLDDRGLIKRIQASIPGWREYRDAEDLRIADALLRSELADRFARFVLPALEEARASAAERLDLAGVREVGVLLGEAQGVMGSIRHAEQGYSGICAAYTIDGPALRRLYDYDSSLIGAVEGVERTADLARTAARTDDGPGLAGACRRVAEGLGEVRRLVVERREAMAGIGVFR